MKLVKFEHGGAVRVGIAEDAYVLPTTATDIAEMLVLGWEPVPNGAPIPLSEVRLLPPLDRSAKSFWAGANYRTLRNIHSNASPEGNHPSLFVRTPASLAGHEQALLRPAESDQLDYEGEVVIVIGKGGRRIPQDLALDHIGGLTIANDGSLRDWMSHSRVNVTAGKNFERSGSLGPWIVTADEIDLSTPLRIETRVNTELRQQDSTDNLRFSFAQLISYISAFAPLQPGDIISTGSPQGAGGGPFGFDPPRWLKAGDLLEISVEGIGTLRNAVIDG